MSTRAIPQCNPTAAYETQATAIDSAIRRVLRSQRYILGPEVAAFEIEFARYVGAAGALGVANGTDALAMALKALGVGSGDVVLTVSHTAVATTVAIRATGASPLFVDVDEGNGLMDMDLLERMLTDTRGGQSAGSSARVKAIIPVHLYGRCLDMDRLMDMASRFGLPVVEDCAQAHGARFNGRAVGSFGAFGCFSFYPTKNLGAIGDGGALVTSNPALLEQTRLQREYGWRQRYISDIEGGNSRLDELQAAVLRVKLTALEADNTARVKIADAYRAQINHPAIRLPAKATDGQHVYHQFAIRCQGRDALQTYLTSKGIGSLIHYPRAVHEQPAYAKSGYAPLPLPRTEAWSREVLSLPMYPQLAMADVEYIANTINRWDGHA